MCLSLQIEYELVSQHVFHFCPARNRTPEIKKKVTNYIIIIELLLDENENEAHLSALRFFFSEKV